MKKRKTVVLVGWGYNHESPRVRRQFGAAMKKKKPVKVSKTAQRAHEKYIKTVVEPAKRLLSFLEKRRNVPDQPRRRSESGG